MVYISGLSKSFKKQIVLRKIDLEFHRGAIYGVIGKNGSGKTTLLNIILQVIYPDSGTVRKDVEASCIGSSFGSRGLYDSFTVYKNLEVMRLLKESSKEDIKELSDVFQIKEFAKKRFSQLSSGMKQKVSLTAAFVGNPELIILDEPTNNLDVEGIFQLRKYLEQKKKENACVIMTSHYLSELEKQCDFFCFLSNGSIRLFEARNSLIAKFGTIENAYTQIIE